MRDLLNSSVISWCNDSNPSKLITSSVISLRRKDMADSPAEQLEAHKRHAAAEHLQQEMRSAEAAALLRSRRAQYWRKG